VDEVKNTIEIAKKLFLKDGYHVPLLLVKGTAGKIAIGLQEFGDTSDKRAQDMLNTGTWLACKHHVGDLELIVFICEAWMGTNVRVLPSQDPNRIEVLQVNSLDVRTNTEAMQAYQIKRDPKGNVNDLKALPFPKGGSVAGRLLPAFLKGYQIVSPVHN
jgi:hypothetical protein